MAKRKRSNRRRSIRKPLRRFTLSKPLLVIVTFAILVVVGLFALQTSLVRSLLGVALANSTAIIGSSTPTRSAPTATPTQPLPIPSPVRVEASWRDYPSPTYGYALKYPPNMIYREGPPFKDVLRSVSFYLEKDSSLPLYQIPEITVSIYANPQSASAADWIAAHQKPSEASAVVLEGVSDVQTTLLDGQLATSLTEKPAGLASAHRIVLARGNLVFSILVTDFGDGALRDTYNAMVSSIRWSAPRP